MHHIYQNYSFLLFEDSGQYCTLAAKKKDHLKIKALMLKLKCATVSEHLRILPPTFQRYHNYYVYILYIIFTAGCLRHRSRLPVKFTNSAPCRKPKVTHQWYKRLGKHLSGKKMLAYAPKLRLHGRMVWVKCV